MSETKHACMPWTAEGGDTTIRDANGAIILDVALLPDRDKMSYREARDLAAFIVRACNAYDDMLAALDQTLDFIVKYTIAGERGLSTKDFPPPYEMESMIRDTIRKAKGE